MIVAGEWHPAVPPEGLASRIIEARIGGPFWRTAPAPPAAADLLVDASADPVAAHALWRLALRDRPAATVAVLVPRSAAGARLERAARRAGSPVIRWPADPHAIWPRMREVHAPAPTATGTLALLAGRVFRVGSPGAPLATLRAADALAAIAGTPYVDPFTGAPATVGRIVEILADWRRVLDANRAIAVATGMSLWKRRRMGQLLTQGERAPVFRRSASGAVRAASRRGGGIAVWSTRVPAGLDDAAAGAGIPILRVEDGFIRSLGLGSDLLPPASVVVDGLGLYLDPSRPSGLERILADTAFDPALLDRAARLRTALVAGGISKYGRSTASPAPEIAAGGRRVVLVPGQVADDLSVRLGGGVVRDNLALLRAARLHCPDAFIVYRPHPDVDAGHRPGALSAGETDGLADLVLRGGSVTRLIEEVDEVHTLTSLAGFEALLRGKRVVAYGQPFYAGWGLTEDRAPIARRTRRLALDELVAGVLILFPRYVDPRTGWPCGPELLLERLGDPSLWRPGLLTRARRLQGRARLALARRQARAYAPKDEIHA